MRMALTIAECTETSNSKWRKLFFFISTHPHTYESQWLDLSLHLKCKSVFVVKWIQINPTQGIHWTLTWRRRKKHLKFKCLRSCPTCTAALHVISNIWRFTKWNRIQFLGKKYQITAQKGFGVNIRSGSGVFVDLSICCSEPADFSCISYAHCSAHLKVQIERISNRPGNCSTREIFPSPVCGSQLILLSSLRQDE